MNLKSCHAMILSHVVSNYRTNFVHSKLYLVTKPSSTNSYPICSMDENQQLNFIHIMDYFILFFKEKRKRKHKGNLDWTLNISLSCAFPKPHEPNFLFKPFTFKQA